MKTLLSKANSPFRVQWGPLYEFGINNLQYVKKACSNFTSFYHPQVWHSMTSKAVFVLAESLHGLCANMKNLEASFYWYLLPEERISWPDFHLQLCCIYWADWLLLQKYTTVLERCCRNQSVDLHHLAAF